MSTYTTHTIALIDDMLAATAPDGDDALMEARLSETLGEINAEDREAAEARVRYISGLTLYSDEEAAEAAGATVVYSGSDRGWLEDEHGRCKYLAAAK